MDLVIVKQILNLAGITNLAIRFDDPNRQIIATFIKNSEMRTANITFADIESMFTEGPSQAPAGPPQDETARKNR